MSTTDRAAFEQYAESQGCRDFEYDQDDSQRYRNPFTQREYKYWRAALAWQAEAAKTTGTACATCNDNGIVGRAPDDYYSCPDCATEAARQPAPALPVKPWETRMQEYFAQGSVKMRTPASFMADEIIDWRAALAATAAPVLSDEQISKMARYLSDFSSAQCGVDKDDAWAIYGNDEIELVRAAFAATRSQP